MVKIATGAPITIAARARPRFGPPDARCAAPTTIAATPTTSGIPLQNA